MAEVRGEILIGRSPEDVFDFVADERHEPLFNPNMTGCELVSGEPVTAGSRFQATLRSARRSMPITVECTALDRPHRLATHSVIGGARIDGDLRFQPEGTGTRMRWHWTITPPRPLRATDRLVGFMGARQERRIWRGLENLMEVSAEGAVSIREDGRPGSPAVVFLHGAGASGGMWRDHMAELSDRFHCLAPDLPGFGRSNHLPPLSLPATAELVADLIRSRIPARRAHLVGLSWGGAIAHNLLEHHPDLIDRVVIDGAGVIPWAPGKLILAGVAATSPFLHTRAVTAVIGSVVGMDDDGRADLRAASPRAFRSAFFEGFHPEPPRKELDAPCRTLLVAGESEKAVRRSNAALASVMPDAVARFVPGGGHGWIGRRPELHARLVEAWLTGGDLPAGLAVEPDSPDAVGRLRRIAGRTT